MKDPILEAFRSLASKKSSSDLLVSLGRSATVGEVNSLALGLAERAAASELPRESLVGLLSPNGSAFAVGYLALRMAGFRVVLLDWRSPPSEVSRVKVSLGLSGVLTARSAWPKKVDEFNLNSFATGGPKGEVPLETSTVKLTSGTTGAPLGIAVTSQALMKDDQALRSTMGLRSERAIAAIPLSHSYGFSSLFLPSLTEGWTLAIPDDAGGPLAAIAIAKDVGATFFPTVPAYLASLVKMEMPGNLPETLRTVISAGARLKASTAARFNEIFGLKVHNFYGASEVGGIAYDRGGGAAERGALGTSVSGVTIRLIGDSGQRDQSGLVEVESPATALGYYPVASSRLGNGRFLSADIGRFDGEELVLTGRSDDLVSVKGKKVNPREVEEVLQSHPLVQEALVFGEACEEGSEEVLVALVSISSPEANVEILFQHCRGTLSSHKVPRRFRLVSSIPRSPRGKIDWQAVGQMFTQPTKPN